MLQIFFALTLLYFGFLLFITLIVVLGFFFFYLWLYAYDPSTADKEFKKLLKYLREDIFGASKK